jgi:Caspase domain
VSSGPESRHALVVATAGYSDPKLQQLRAPGADAERLAAVLRDPQKGDFEVEVLLDESHATVTRRIASFFRDRRPQDLLLLHFSCHGVKDDRGELYLAAADTEIDLLSATGISAAWLNEQISRTRARRTVLLLDCCFSGSFPFGMRARAGTGVDAPGQFQGRGRAIITASNAMEYAYEGDRLRGEGQPSIFTTAVVEGLETGEADLDRDQLVSVDDLYNYVYDRVKDATPSQTPIKKSELEGPLYLARSQRPEPEPAEAPVPGLSEGAARELAALLGSAQQRPPPRRVPWRVIASAAAAVAALAAAVVAVVVLAGGDGEGPPAGPIPAGNRTANPSFETDTAGWDVFQSSLGREQAGDAPDGDSVVRVTLDRDEGGYSIDDDPETIEASLIGRAYTATAWVKATDSTDGRDICIQLREWNGGEVVDFTSGSVRASTAEYRQAKVTHVATDADNPIGVHVFRFGETPQEAFLVDAVAVVEGRTGPPATPASSSC